MAAKADLRFVERPDDLTRAFIGDREVTDDIRGREVSKAVSPVSADGAVRALLTAQAAGGGRSRRRRPRRAGTPARSSSPTPTSRSIWSPPSRSGPAAARAQLLAQGVDQPVDELVSDIAARDAYDSGRALAPLCKADDAVEIDTTGMTIPEVIEAVCALVEAKRAAAPVGGRGARPSPGGRSAVAATRPPRPAQEVAALAGWSAARSTLGSTASPTRSSLRYGD